jgi:site-specific DNA-methyltransferase (adenine-specific)
MIKGTTTTSTLSSLGLPIATDLQSDIYLMDCMEAMRQYPDNYFDLAVVDPPYGIDITKDLTKDNSQNKSFMGCSKSIIQGKHWDKSIPNKEYFNELKRVSKNQIIWGGNYFLDYLNNTRCFCVWDKMNGTNSMADAEIAWTSFDSSVRMFRMHHFSSGYGSKIHPTQKPVKLYDWIFKNYAEPGQKILDTHLGSGSSRISAHKAGLNFTGFELDADYFAASEKRFKEYVAQMRLF